MTHNNSIQLTAAGDAMITRRVSHREGDERFDTLVERIRATDVGIINLEVLLHDYEGYPAAQNPGTAMRAPPWTADELTWMGWDMFTTATNHAIDYSHGGMEVTMGHLTERNVPYAGMGRNLTDALSPAYLETRGGRVGLVNACSTIATGSEAGKQRPDVKGRPGIAPLHLDTRYVIPEEAYESLVEISEGLGLEALKQWKADIGYPIVSDDEFRFVVVGGDTNPAIEVGDDFKVRLEPDRDDVDAVLRQIRDAERQADWVVASLHAHEGRGARSTDETVARFLESFARECIDAGADAFVGHGSHCLHGIEIYEGAPIFYSLGNFIAQSETIERMPAGVYSRYGFNHDASPADLADWRNFDEDGNRRGFLEDSVFYETVLPVVDYENGELASIELYPVELNFETSRPSRGDPSLTDEETGERILERLAELSAAYGTEIASDGNVGGVKI